jgi:hypothetical protein
LSELLNGISFPGDAPPNDAHAADKKRSFKNVDGQSSENDKH